MRWRRGARVRGCRRAGPPAAAQTTRCRRRLPHALGPSAGVRGHGAAGRAGGAAPATRPQASPSLRMGEAAANTGDGGPHPRDGGAGDASAVRRGGGAARPAAQHIAARRRVRAGRASAATSPISASRVDAKFPASTEQVRERRARVGGRGHAGAARGGRGRGSGRGRGGGRGRGRGVRGQEGRAAAEGDALVGPHGRAPARALPAAQRAAALRHGAAPRALRAAARRVTTHASRTPLSYHAYIPLSGRTDSPKCSRVPEYYRLGIYLFGTGGGGAARTRL